MRRRHMIVEGDKIAMTLCGHQLSRGEVYHQRKNTWDRVNCKRCLHKRGFDNRDLRIEHTVYEYRGDHRSDVP